MINKAFVLTILLSCMILGIAAGILAAIEVAQKRNKKKNDDVDAVALDNATQPEITELSEEEKEFIVIMRERKNKKQIAEEFIQRVNPYEASEEKRYIDLRAYTDYVKKNNLSGEDITEDILKLFTKE